MDEITLYREGWQPITIRRNGEGYEMQMYVDHYGGKRWQKIPFSNEVVEAQVERGLTQRAPDSLKAAVLSLPDTVKVENALPAVSG
jgi:MinD superfamily P-loop ATPase